MDKQLKKSLLIGGGIGLGVGIVYLLTAFIMGSYIAEGSIILEKIGMFLFFTIGIPHIIIIYLSNIIGVTSDAYIFHVAGASLILYTLIGSLIYCIHYKIKNRKKP